MTRKVYLGNYGYSKGCRIGNNFANLVLGVPETFPIWRTVIALLTVQMAYDCFFADGSEGGQFRIFLYLYPPPLIVGQMPVETVEFMHSHHVQILFNLVY